MSTAAHAIAPPLRAAVPPVQRKAEPRSETQEAPQRLLTSLSSVPAVQRKSAPGTGEENEDRMPVQPRLEVGAVDDPYEREADGIAGQIMAMRRPAIQRINDTEEDTDAGVMARRRNPTPSVQRNVDEEEEAPDDLVQARRSDVGAPSASILSNSSLDSLLDKPESEEVRLLRAPTSIQRTCVSCDDDTAVRPRTKPDAAAVGTEHIAASATQLTSGGSELSGATREFFESRMDRDLSQVRVHTGTVGSALNASIRARAFTYRNHIWLGPGEGAGQTFTMAHELAHVLQQTAPGPVGPQARRTGSDGNGAVQRKPIKIFGGDPYWASQKLDSQGSSKSTGSIIHENILPMFQQADPNIFYEVPVPTSTFTRSGRSKTKRADLYKGVDQGNNPRTVGVNFVAKDKPRKVSWRTFQAHNKTYSHGSSARPRVRGVKNLVVEGLAEAPVSITLGELKPQGQINKGEKQLSGYEAGFAKTRAAANQFSKDNAADPMLAPQWPQISFNRLNVAMPDPQKIPDLSGEHELAVHEFAGLKSIGKNRDFAKGTLIHRPPTPVKGRLRANKNGNGIYYYWWEPTSGAVNTPLPSTLVGLVPVTKAMMKALRTNRRVVLPPVPAASAAPAAPAPKRSGNAKPYQNQFDANAEKAWNNRQKGVKAAFSEPEGTDILTNDYLVQIDDGLGKDKKGLATKLKGTKPGERLKEFRDIRMISKPWAPLMAKARRLFGGVFAKASDLYARIKAKFSKRATLGKMPSGGGFLGGLIKAALKVLLLIGRQIVAGTMIQLTAKLKACMERMFESWYESSSLKAVEDRVTGLSANIEQKLLGFVGLDPEHLSETLFGPYADKVDKVRGYIETIKDIAGPILTAYKVVKWGVRVVACLSPPLVGCLWGLATSAIDWAVGKLMQTCWFMQKIAPTILKIEKIKNFVNNVSSELSSVILSKAGEILPEPVGGFLKDCDQNPPKVADPDTDSICDEARGGGEEGAVGGGMSGGFDKPDPRASKFWERWTDFETKHFEKSQLIKQKMLGSKIAAGGAKVDWDKMEAMLDWAEKADLSTVKEAAKKAAAGDSSAIPKPVAALKAAAEKAVASGNVGSQKGVGTGGGTDGGDARDTGKGKTVTTPQLRDDGTLSGEATEAASDLHVHSFDLRKGPDAQSIVSGILWVQWNRADGTSDVLPWHKRFKLQRRFTDTDKVERFELVVLDNGAFSISGRPGRAGYKKGRVLHVKATVYPSKGD